jgi:hypothetical protein
LNAAVGASPGTKDPLGACPNEVGVRRRHLLPEGYVDAPTMLLRRRVLPLPALSWAVVSLGMVEGHFSSSVCVLTTISVIHVVLCSVVFAVLSATFYLMKMTREVVFEKKNTRHFP